VKGYICDRCGAIVPDGVETRRDGEDLCAYCATESLTPADDADDAKGDQ